MFGFLRPKPSRPETSLAMVDPRASDAVLFLDAATAALAGESGAITCLNGRTVVVAPRADDVARVEREARKAGGLVEFVKSLDEVRATAAEFQIVVAPDISKWPSDSWRARFGDAVQFLLPGGRLIAMAGTEPTGGLVRISRPAPAIDVEAVLGLLKTLGLVAVRKLATSNGVHYFEARRGR